MSSFPSWSFRPIGHFKISPNAIASSKSQQVVVEMEQELPRVVYYKNQTPSTYWASVASILIYLNNRKYNNKYLSDIWLFKVFCSCISIWHIQANTPKINRWQVPIGRRAARQFGKASWVPSQGSKEQSSCRLRRSAASPAEPPWF
jgi:hypothetical protein